MRITRPRATKISQITIDTDLDMGAHSLKTDTVSESTVDAGVEVEGVKNKDSVVVVHDINAIWKVSTATWLQEFNTGAEETVPNDLFFKPDGTKMYLVGDTGDDVNEYDLSTAWDISTAVFLQLFSVAAKETNPGGIFFNPEGTKMYILGQNNDNVNEYDLGTPWDVTSAVYLQLVDVSGQDGIPRCVFFNPTGTKMYVTGQSNFKVFEYDLGTPWSVISAVFLQDLDVSTRIGAPSGIFFKPDGTKMHLLSLTNDDINEFDLSTAWDISTAVWRRFLDVVGRQTGPTGLFFKPDGTKMYHVGTGDYRVHEYDL